MNTRVIDWQQYAQVARNPLIWLIILLTGGLVYIFKSPSPATQPIAPPALQGSLPSGLGTIAPPVTEAPAALPAGPLETASGAGLSFAPKVFIVLLFAVIYLLAYKSWMNYPLLFVLGAVVTVYFGAQMQFYDTGLALKSLVRNLDVIFFLVGMNLVTAALALGGLFDHLGRKISSLARDDPWRIMLWFCLTTYTLSLLVNNLTTMLVLTPIILSLSRRLDLDPQPYLVGMIVASNLGGASTMIGDFPNILIGTKAGVSFNQFLTHMLPICLVLFSILLVYLRLTQSRLWTKDERRRTKDEGRRTKDDSSFVLVSEANGRPSSFVPRPSSFKNPRAVRRGLFILALAVAGFLVSDQLGLPPALIAIDAGLAALFFTGLDTNQILKELDYRDTFFFAGLFVLVGAAQASGLLNWFAQFIVHLSFGNVLVRCLLLMWVAAAATAFFNAGPCTALFLPLVLGFKTEAPQNLYWWSLSLGVLAGSSATLIGATAGSVTATMLSRSAALGAEPKDPEAPVARRELRGRSWGQRPWPSAHQKQKGSEQKGSDPHQKKPSGGGLTPSALTPSALTFYSYARVAAPLALIFLTVSSVYVAWLYRYG